MRKLKQQRATLVICLALSMLLHLLYGLEGIRQVSALERQIEQQAIEIMGKQEQLETYQNIETEAVEGIKYVGEFEITYYCACTTCCGKTDGITATGAMVKEGQTIATDWNILPKGTRVYIDGVGFRTVEDKGGAIKGKMIDVYGDSHQAALNAGRHTADVWIVED